MEMQTIVHRHDRYYLIATVDRKMGDFPFETTIVLSDTTSTATTLPVYRCSYKTIEFAISGHYNLVRQWPEMATSLS
jgi:hypothetical protein